MRAPVALTAIPDRRRRPSDGLVVEARIVARLLGLRLLTLDATVVVVPAEVTDPASAPHDLPPRDGLAEAVRLIDEGAAILTEVRAS
jgi:hypothetical protein